MSKVKTGFIRDRLKKNGTKCAPFKFCRDDGTQSRNTEILYCIPRHLVTTCR